jgi:uroporphyrinogen III methyltransferase/synthase
VKNLLTAAGRVALEDVRIASIGPVTSETARAHGLKVDAEAKQYTLDGLIQALLEATP